MGGIMRHFVIKRAKKATLRYGGSLVEQYNQSSPFLFDLFCTGVVSVFPSKSSYEADINELNFMWSHVRFPSRIIWALMLAELSDGCLATIQIIFYAGVALTEDDYVLQSVDHPVNPSFFFNNLTKKMWIKGAVWRISTNKFGFVLFFSC